MPVADAVTRHGLRREHDADALEPVVVNVIAVRPTIISMTLMTRLLAQRTRPMGFDLRLSEST